ncbi:fibronectin type III domain-containing protein [Stygiolobus caldivivus]|uniref:fibronectin type III domain-containing protein n=1 Tax=Stygiolobus caldivivus TaxID=2824673 RepID=UPI001C849175|nr:fibronectin type III domain-containing protein [Stygiolobus caldivivus]
MQSLPIPIQDPAVAYYNGSIYVIGGNTAGPYPVPNVYVYSDGKWVQGPSLPFALAGARAVVYDGSLYVVGGANFTNIFGGVLKLQGDHWVVVSNSMPRPVYNEIVFVYNNELYVVGGANFTGFTISPPSDLIQVYSFQTGQWEIIGKTPQPLSDSGYFFNGTVLYVVGGYIGYADDTACVYEYFPANNSWVKLTPLSSGIEGEALGYQQGVIYIVGGYFFNHGIIDPGVVAYYYNGSWYYPGFVESVPTEYSGYVQVGDTLYIVGGNELPSQDFTNAFQSIKIELPPPRPNLVYYTAGNGTVTLVWDDNSSSGYYINYWGNNGQRGSIITYSTSYTFSNLVDGVTYHFQIIPFNKVGNGTPSEIITLTPFSVPNTPLVKVKLGDKNATVMWRPTFNGGFPIEGYYLFIEGGNLRFEENVGNISSYTFTNLTPGVTYRVGVIAYNEFGNSSPAEVEFVAITKANVSLVATRLVNGLLLSWNSSQPSKFILIVSSNGKMLENLSLSNYSILLNLPFGTYNVTLEAVNQAGIQSTSLLVNYYLVPPLPQVQITLEGNLLNVNWTDTPYATYYLVYVNGTLFENTTLNHVTVPLTPGKTGVQIVAGNALYHSEPQIYTVYLSSYSNVVITDTTSTDANSTIVHSILPVTSTVDGLSINLTTALVILVLFIVSLAIIMVVIEREK